MKTKAIFFMLIVVTILSYSVILTAEEVKSISVDTAAESSLGQQLIALIDYLDNGTLYNYNIHHKRPAKGIYNTKNKKKYKTFAESLSYSVNSDFLSKYVYEGEASSRSWVWQPSATIEAYGLGFNAWGNFVLADIPDQGRFNEIDLTLYYNYNYKNLSVQPFFIACIYPTANKISLDYSASTDMKPSLHLAYTLGPIDIYTDVQLYVHPTPGAVIWDMGLGFQHKIVKDVAISTAAQISFGNAEYNNSQFQVKENKVQQFTYELSVSITPVKGFVIEPNINVAAFFSQVLRDAVAYPVLVWGGVDFTYNF